jgi:hypothetical protein
VPTLSVGLMGLLMVLLAALALPVLARRLH